MEKKKKESFQALKLILLANTVTYRENDDRETPKKLHRCIRQNN